MRCLIPCSMACSTDFLQDPSDVLEAQQVVDRIGEAHLPSMKLLAIQMVLEEAKKRAGAQQDNANDWPQLDGKIIREQGADITELSKVPLYDDGDYVHFAMRATITRTVEWVATERAVIQDCGAAQPGPNPADAQLVSHPPGPKRVMIPCDAPVTRLAKLWSGVRS